LKGGGGRGKAALKLVDGEGYGGSEGVNIKLI